MKNLHPTMAANPESFLKPSNLFLFLVLGLNEYPSVFCRATGSQIDVLLSDFRLSTQTFALLILPPPL